MSELIGWVINEVIGMGVVDPSVRGKIPSQRFLDPKQFIEVEIMYFQELGEISKEIDLLLGDDDSDGDLSEFSNTTYQHILDAEEDFE